MRGSYQRTRSYKKKIRGFVLPDQVQHKLSTVKREVDLERMVEAIVGPSLLRGHYMIFAKELNKLIKKFKDQTLWTEACIKYDKWVARGLNTTFLDTILTRMNLPLCVPIVFPCDHWLTEEECEVHGCCWTGLHCIEGPCECEDYETQEECEENGCYWYDDSCHLEPQPVQHVEIRYMRGDTHTVNGLLAYKLLTTQSAIAREVTFSSMHDLAGTWGIRVWKRTSAGVETEITAGTPVATVSRTTDGYGMQSNTWTCPLTAMNPTDAIVVRVYTECDGWKLTATFITEQLGADTLDNALWRVYYYTKRYTNLMTGRYYYTFYWGINTRPLPYDSRMTNFTWTG